MAESKVMDEVELTALSWANAQVPQWQSLIKDGRKISTIAINIAIDSAGQKSFDVTVQYASTPPVNVVTSPTGE